MQQHTADTAAAQHNHDDSEYRAFLARVQVRFLQRTEDGARPAFLVDAGDLWSVYLDSFSDAADRQYHNCSACRKFIDRFGSLAVVEEGGSVRSALWDATDAPEEYKKAVSQLAHAIRHGKIRSPFLSREAVLGVPEVGGWAHLSIALPEAMRYTGVVLNPGQAMAAKREDFKKSCTR